MAGKGLPIIDMAGKRFARLLVQGIDRVVKGSGAYWRCLCDCGRTHIAHGRHLRSGATKSCGCLRGETCAITRTRHGCAKHGRRSAAYTAWCSMKKRCENARGAEYQHYGGRGIAVCPLWKTFEAFLADMGEPPSGATLERVDNNGDYERKNCRWATRAEQSNNTRSNVIVICGGRRLTLAQFAQLYRLPYERTQKRMKRGHRNFGGVSVEVFYPNERTI